MEIFRDPVAVQQWAETQRRAGRTIGLVPTMGFLHEGHASLIDAARGVADAVIVSVFVNPVQFGPKEDYAAYPRDEAHDLTLCEAHGASAVFLPMPEVMYASDASVMVSEDVLSTGLCGARRPGHFRGVCTVVAKLFNIAQPQVAVFGQKDFQQAAVIQRMVRDLNFPIRIIVAPIVREADGLAKSSRNTYLNAEERARATGLNRTLTLLADAVAGQGAMPWMDAERLMRESLTAAGLDVDYVAVVDAETLRPVDTVLPGHVALIAVYDGRTRLIDNRVL